MSDFDDKATVTGAIASFNNGADEVPVDSGTFYIAPSQSGTGTPSPSNPRPLVGYTGMTITHTHKNLAYEVYEYNARNMIISPVYLPQGQYTISFSRGVNVQYIYVRKGDTVNLTGDAYATKSNSTFFTFTADESTYYYVQLYRTATSDTWEDYPVTNPQIEAGSTQTAYTAYTAPETLAVSWQTEAGTVYGGERKTDGTLTETRKTLDMGDLTWSYVSSSQYQRFVTSVADIQDMDAPTSTSVLANLMCEIYDTIPYTNVNAQSGTNLVIGACKISGTVYIVVRDTDYTDKDAFKSAVTGHKISYELATPNEYTLSPISLSTYYGDNNVWCDTGDSEVTYYKSGYGFTSVTVNQKDGNDELIATKTAKLHKVIYGGEVDVIQGKAEPKNLIQLYTRGSNAGVDYSINADGSLHREGTATSNSYNNGNASSYDACPYKLPAGTYTISVSGSSVPDDYASFGIITKSGTQQNSQNVYGNTTKTFTVNEDFGSWFWTKIAGGATVDDNVYIWLEKGSSPSDYAPHFEPFTFPPISMETVEGTNVLYANEGDSTITYRKSAD